MSQDIFRKYPNKYETIISTLCENLDSLDEPEARAAMIWIVGEYAERIDNADEILQSFLDGFHDENTQVHRRFFKMQGSSIILLSFSILQTKNRFINVFILGAATTSHCYCETVPEKATRNPGVGPESSIFGNSGLRQP